MRFEVRVRDAAHWEGQLVGRGTRMVHTRHLALKGGHGLALSVRTRRVWVRTKHTAATLATMKMNEPSPIEMKTVIGTGAWTSRKTARAISCLAPRQSNQRPCAIIV